MTKSGSTCSRFLHSSLNEVIIESTFTLSLKIHIISAIH